MNDKMVRRKIYSKKDKQEQQQETIVKIMKEWNILVLSFVSAKDSWEKIRALILRLSNLDLLTSSLQRKIYRVCVTTQFHHAVRSLLDLLNPRDDIKDLLVSDLNTNKKKEMC